MRLALSVVGFVVAEIVIVGSILSFVFRKLWKPLAEQFPKLAVTEPAFSKQFQSFSVGVLNLGGCVHVTLDDNCLHLRPARLLRWMGLTDISIPWEKIKMVRQQQTGNRRRPFPRYVTVRVGTTVVCGPAWCFKLVFEPTSSSLDEHPDETDCQERLH